MIGDVGVSGMVVDQLDRKGVNIWKDPHLILPKRCASGVAERVVAPLLSRATCGHRLEFGELADEPNCISFTDDGERCSALDPEVVPERLGDRQPPSIVY